jgi:hypothetical protein
MLFRHYQLRFVFPICLIAISCGAFIKEEIQITIPHIPSINDVSSVTCINRSNVSLFVRQHIQIENNTRHIYISPLALFDVNQTRLISNPTTHRTTLIIPLILYTDEQIKIVRENNTNECQKSSTKCLFHQISTETMRVIYKEKLDQTVVSDSSYRYINSIRLSYNPVLNQSLLYINIDCTSNEGCLKLDEILHRRRQPIGFYLEYSIQKAEQHQMIITNKHLLKTNIYSSKVVLERDIDQFLQEVLDAAGIGNDDEYVLSQIDSFLLKETLKKQLLGRIWILTDDNDEKQWNSIYWKNNQVIRPDRLLKLFKKKINSKYLPEKITKSNTEIDNYVSQIYDEQSFDLYLKYRHLFELHQTNNTDRESSLSLKLKPILAYEINKFNRSNFLIHQTIHMTKRDHIHLMPIRSILPLTETQRITVQSDDNPNILEQFKSFIQKIMKVIESCLANKHQPSTESSTTERRQHNRSETYPYTFLSCSFRCRYNNKRTH